MKKGNFYINNEYHSLYNIYKFYCDKVKLTLKENNWREVSNYSFALIISFFSLQEFLLNVFYAFENDGVNLTEFIKNDRWIEKFRAVFNISNPKEIKQLYDGLLKLREDFRNPLSHGLIGETRAFVAFPTIGLIPLSFEYLSKAPHYDVFMIRESEAQEIIDQFEGIFRYLLKTDPFRYYMLYLEGGFTIPATKKDLTDIKAEMTSYDNFKKYVEERSEYENRLNRDI